MKFSPKIKKSLQFSKVPLWFLLSLTGLTGLISISLVLIRPTNPFYVVDPGPAYVANGLEFLQIHKIFMMDHPGTPLVLFLFLVFAPIKLVVKLLGLSNFTLWALKNFTLIYWISILMAFLVFIAGLFLLHLAIYKAFKSYKANLLLFLLLFLRPAFFIRMPTIITPEIFGFFFFSVWLNFLVTYDKERRKDWLILAGFFAGLSIASKLTFLFVPVATVFISTIFSEKKGLLRKVINNTNLGVLLSIFGGFGLGTFAAMKDRLGAFLYWTSGLITHVGRSGGGTTGFISASNYLANLGHWLNYLPFIGLIVLVVYSVFRNRTEKTTIWWGIFAGGFLGFVVFLKYSEQHYQFANLLLISASFLYFFTRFNTKFKWIALLAALLSIIPSAKKAYAKQRSEIVKDYYLQQYVNNNYPTGSIVIWEFAPTQRYALIRGRDWSNFFYVNEMEKVMPKNWLLYYLDMTKILDNYGRPSDINAFCWDGMIIRESIWEKFISQQKNPQIYMKKEIPHTQMYEVGRLDCL